MQDNPPHVLIIGGGFGGLTAARALCNSPVKITLLDRANHHLFQPLLYQVALAALSPADIAYPIRSVLRKQSNINVVMDEAVSVDLSRSRVKTRNEEIEFDYLILASGSGNNYYGHDNWKENTFGLKDLRDAIEIRKQVLSCFEKAELCENEQERRELLTFLIIGGGPTGVELAGSLAELARTALQSDFRRIKPETTRVVLLEGGKRILLPFPEDLSKKAAEQLKKLGVEVQTDALVTDISREGAIVSGNFMPAKTILWCAGVKATKLTESLNVPLDRDGRIIVREDLSIEGYPKAFVIGDAASFSHDLSRPLPGVAPVAMQAGRRAAENISNLVSGKETKAFKYDDKGSLATIGKSAAVADLHILKLSGFPAWLAWLLVHILFLIGFRNKFIVIFSWMWSYFTNQRGARLIVDYHETE